MPKPPTAPSQKRKTCVAMTLKQGQQNKIALGLSSLEEAFAGPWFDVWQTWDRMSDSDRQRVREASPTFDRFMRIAERFA